MHIDPALAFIIVLLIGIVLGLLFDRVLGRGWLSRQIAGGRHVIITSALVGVAGSFVGYHVALLFLRSGDIAAFVIAAVGALVVLWIWRMVR